MSRTTAHYEDTDLAMFALQLLEGEEHQAAAEHVSGCAFCRQELARLHGDLAACAYGVEMHAPASLVRERLMHRVAREKRAIPPAPIEEVIPAPLSPMTVSVEPAEEEPRLEFRRRSADAEPKPRLEFRRRAAEPEPEPRVVKRQRPEDKKQRRQSGGMAKGIFVWLGWAIAAGFAVAGVRLYQQQMEYRTRLAIQTAEVSQLQANSTGARRLMEAMTDHSAQRALLSPPQTDSGSLAEGHVIYEADKGSLVLLADHLAPVGIDKIYELWLIPADGSNPIPAGTFHPDAQGNGNVILPSLPRAIEVKAFGVTVEDGAGSQTPTMPIVLAGS
jgi:hypothetical protein